MDIRNKDLFPVLNFLASKKMFFNYEHHKNFSCNVTECKYIFLIVLKTEYYYLYFSNRLDMDYYLTKCYEKDYIAIQMFDSNGKNLNNTHPNIKTIIS